MSATPIPSWQPSSQPPDLAALRAIIWRESHAAFAMLAVAAGLLVLAFWPGLVHMVQTWQVVEEYSYGYFIPVIVAFLIWQKTDVLRHIETRASWGGLALVLAGLFLCVASELSAIQILMQYGFVVALFGLALCHLGWQGTRVIAVALAVSVFMIPLPQFFLRELSEHLQLLSSTLGVLLIRAFDISVYLEGNVIDLGTYKLQVVEACSGLRYLFPLMALGFIAAYFFKAPLWKRAFIFLSTIPLTVLMNSLRIGMIGVSVEYWGVAMAEGVLHDFEGWLMFMVCMLVLIAEMAVLARLGGRGVKFAAVFGLEFPALADPASPVRARQAGAPLKLAIGLLALFSLFSMLMPAREIMRPARTMFSEYPATLDDWTGRSDTLPSDVVAALKLDDYVMINYARKPGELINFYSAYYGSQSGGDSTHSPRTCMPGGGWEITDLSQVNVAVLAGGASIPVNRAVIQRGEQRQLVYYFFKQRDRWVTSEYQVKWYIFYDGMMRHRSDGALVRLVTPLQSGENMEAADARLKDFLTLAAPRLATFVPD